jgi:hypothetical protein
MCYEHAGQGHGYCRNCSHIVRQGAQCTGCGAQFAGLMPFDRALDHGYVDAWGGTGFDSGNGPFAHPGTTPFTHTGTTGNLVYG